MSIPREEHDAKIEALEARVDGRVVGFIPLLQGIREDLRETRSEIRESRRHNTATSVAIIIAVVTTGVSLHQAVLTSMDSIAVAFASGRSVQPQIHVVPHPVATGPDPVPATTRVDASQPRDGQEQAR